MTSRPPGTAFFAPQVQLTDAKSGRVIYPPSGGDSGTPVDADLISTRVTQAHHGVSTVTLTFNNQRTTGRRAAQPPWKYNDMATFKFGQRLLVEVRYGGDIPWTPLILARITDINFSFPSGGGAQVTVQGEDLLSLFKSKPAQAKSYRDKQELDIVNDVLTRSKTGLALASPLVERPTFTETLSTMTHQKAQTFLQFLESLAERMDFEVFVDFDDPERGSSGVNLHFEPARSLGNGGTVVDLGWGTNLVSFNPKFKVWEQFTTATASGRHARNRRRIDETVEAAAVTSDLKQESNGPKPINAIEARHFFFSNENSPSDNEESVTVSHLDEQRARLKAESVLRARARELLTATASTFGFARLRPGIHVNIKNLYAPFDGLYYVTQAVHTLDSGGFKTECSLRRPGMLQPQDYPAAS